MLKFISVLLTLFSLSHASVEIYQDKAKLVYVPKDTFIGFNNQIKANDSGGDIKLVRSECVNSKVDACISVNKISELTNLNSSFYKQKSILEQALNEFCYDSSDPNKTISYIKTVSDKIVDIEKSIIQNNFLIEKEKEKRVLPVLDPYSFLKPQTNEVTLEFRGITFKSKYLLDIDKRRLEQKIQIVNRSGIDIKNTDATILDRRLSGITQNYKFQPKLIYIRRPIVLKEVRSKSMQADSLSGEQAQVMYTSSSESEGSFANVATKESTRNYKIKNFSSISDGIAKEFIVDQQNVNISKKVVWNAWENGVFESAEVTLQEPLENTIVDLRYKNSMTQNVNVRREGENLVLNISQDFDVNAKREEIPNYSKEKGFFNTDTLTKRGYRLFITNLSKTTKKLSVIEKIPLSTDENIEVKLEGVWLIKDKTNTSTEFSYDEKIGKLSLELSLEAGESREYEYAFIIKHPKDLIISY